MIVVVMGVAGCGKTTVGRGLAQRHGWHFYDADDYHPAANIEKMGRGIPLTDADRAPWLQQLNELLGATQSRGESAVLACSALKQRYRDRIGAGLTDLRWIHLAGNFDLIQRRLEARKGHYMKAGMLRSQFEALEPPSDALVVDITPDPQELIETTARWLQGQEKATSP